MARLESKIEALRRNMLGTPTLKSRKSKDVQDLLDNVEQALENIPADTSELLEILETLTCRAENASLCLSDVGLFTSNMVPFIASLPSIPGYAYKAWEAVFRLILVPDTGTLADPHILIPSEIETGDRKLDNSCVDVMLVLFRNGLLESDVFARDKVLDLFKSKATRRKECGINSFLSRSIQFLEVHKFRNVLHTKVAIALSETHLPLQVQYLVATHLVCFHGLDEVSSKIVERWRSFHAQWSPCQRQASIDAHRSQTTNAQGCGATTCSATTKVRWDFRRRQWLVTHGKHFAIRCPLGRHCTGHHDSISIPTF